MKSRPVPILAAVVVLAIAAGGVLLYLRAGGTGAASSGTSSEALVGSAAIVAANLSSSYHSVALTVKNTGTADLLLLGEPSLSPAGSAYCGTWGWNPTPATTNPIAPGETVKGNCILEGSTYAAGQHVTISIAAGFSDGSQSRLSVEVTVVP